jgi:hypothetical protein
MKLKTDATSGGAILIPALLLFLLGIFLIISQLNIWVKQRTNDQFYQHHGVSFQGKIVEFSDVKAASQRAYSSRSAAVFIQILPNQGLSSPTYLQLDRINFVSILPASDLQKKWVGSVIPMQCNLQATRCQIQLHHELNQPRSVTHILLLSLLGVSISLMASCLLYMLIKIPKAE